jgi:hypothetical protein
MLIYMHFVVRMHYHDRLDRPKTRLASLDLLRCLFIPARTSLAALLEPVCTIDSWQCVLHHDRPSTDGYLTLT